MRSNAGMANRQGDDDLRFAQVSAPQLELWLGLAWKDRVQQYTVQLSWSLAVYTMSSQVTTM